MRKPRVKSSTGIYHIVSKGIDHQDIFIDDWDRQKYLHLLKKKTLEHGSELLGFCLMSNHVHLLVNEGEGSVSELMQSIGISYAFWFNQKYDRNGYLFQNRFHSECIENDQYILTVIRYIHFNPVKAGIVKAPEEYRWSSCKAYCGKEDSELAQTDFILGLFSDNRMLAQKSFHLFMQEDDPSYDPEESHVKRKSDKEVAVEIEIILGDIPIAELKNMNRAKRDSILRELKGIEGSSIRQIARLTDIGVKVVHQA